MKHDLNLGDVVEGMKKLPNGSVSLAFSDPPFNIGYSYDEYEDKLPLEQYRQFTSDWANQAYRILRPNGSLWVCGSDHFISEMDVAIREQGFTKRSWVIWYYTFGQNVKTNFTKSHTHMLYYVRNPKSYVFNADDPEVRHPSARQLVYKDKRANKKGRLPDDTWCLLKEQVELQSGPMDDVWVNSRVCGTFGERLGGHSCQMPEAILERIVRLCSNAGDTVADLFIGTGTTSVVCEKLGRDSVGWETSENYLKAARERLAAASK